MIENQISNKKMKIFNISCSVIVVLIALCSCNEKYDQEKPIIIAGKILNYNSQKENIDLTIYRVCAEEEKRTTKISSNGEFYFCFKSFIPLSSELNFNRATKVLAYPGDSIYVEIDGKEKDYVKLFEKTKFYGDSEKLNNDINAFFFMYYSDYESFTKTDLQQAAMSFDVEHFELYLDSIEEGYDQFLNQYVNIAKPSDEAKQWTEFYLMNTVYNMMIGYVFYHPFEDQSRLGQFQIPVSFYDRITQVTPLDYNTFLCSQELHYYLNRYLNWYIVQNMVAEQAYKQGLAEKGYVAPARITDSVKIDAYLKYTPDPLLYQLIYAEQAKRNFERLNVCFYESNKALYDEIIKEPFLKQTISDEYNALKKKLDNPKLASDAILKKVGNTLAKALMDSIMAENKGKVIYIDCWADYCGPCLAELPNSKALMDELKDEDVAFVYICLSADRRVWKALLGKHQLGGQHYLFNENQKEDWKKAFEISGIPYYFLIDTNGTIVENGSYLKPNVAKEKIEKLLN